ncbi:MAG: hypothetical protein QGF68_06100 [Nitrospinota bacterium]|jgi:hypothetical protein|nr:hypothetical protein [Nitrospinota bacterium]HJM44134.1 hypothetical protein [Nitrospinota bacterium]
MEKKEFEHDDPMELVSFALPQGGEEMEREMARCLADEFTRMGVSEEDLLIMFRNPFYSVLNGVYQSLGEAVVVDLIAEARTGWIPADESRRDCHAESL